MGKTNNLMAQAAVISAGLAFATAAKAIETYEPTPQNEAFVACFEAKPEIAEGALNQRVSELMQERIVNGDSMGTLLSDALNSFYWEYQMDCAEQTGMEIEEVFDKMQETEMRNEDSLANGNGQGMVELFRPVIRQPQ